MVKRETEKETEEDLKQVFRVFDKVSRIAQKLQQLLFDTKLGWKWIHFNIRNKVCPDKTWN